MCILRNKYITTKGRQSHETDDGNMDYMFVAS